MTLEKITYYIGANLVNHICSLNYEQLEKQKAALLIEIEREPNGTERRSRLLIELKLIDARLTQ